LALAKCILLHTCTHARVHASTVSHRNPRARVHAHTHRRTHTHAHALTPECTRARAPTRAHSTRTRAQCSAVQRRRRRRPAGTLTNDVVKLKSTLDTTHMHHKSVASEVRGPPREHSSALHIAALACVVCLVHAAHDCFLRVNEASYRLRHRCDISRKVCWRWRWSASFVFVFVGCWLGTLIPVGSGPRATQTRHR
jgi:hypothetical protein